MVRSSGKGLALAERDGWSGSVALAWHEKQRQETGRRIFCSLARSTQRRRFSISLLGFLLWFSCWKCRSRKSEPCTHETHAQVFGSREELKLFFGLNQFFGITYSSTRRRKSIRRTRPIAKLILLFVLLGKRELVGGGRIRMFVVTAHQQHVHTIIRQSSCT